MAGRNLERTVGSGKRKDALFGRLLGEDHAELGLVPGGMAVRRVVDLEDDVRAGFDELGLARLKDLGGLAGRVADQEIAGERAGVWLLLGLYLRRREENARSLTAKPVRIGLAHERDDVVDDHTVGGTNFGGLHPHVLSEARGHDDVLVV